MYDQAVPHLTFSIVADFYTQWCAVVPMGFLYLMSNLNRSNLGNANIAGMPEEIGLVGNQFGVATTLLYAIT